MRVFAEVVVIPIYLPLRVLRPLVEGGQVLANVQVFCARQNSRAKQVHQRDVDAFQLVGLQRQEFGQRAGRVRPRRARSRIRGFAHRWPTVQEERTGDEAETTKSAPTAAKGAARLIVDFSGATVVPRP